MESAAAWAGPYELRLAMNETTEEAPVNDAQVWAPAVGHPLQYASSIADIFAGSSWSLQPYVAPASSSSSGGQHQLLECNYYNYYAQHQDPTGKGTTSFEEQMETYMNNPTKLFVERKDEFKADAKLMKMKMHRYPPSIRDLGDWCTVPKVVAIGPYYHRHCDKLKQTEKVKHVAAYCCIQQSGGRSVEELYGAVISAVDKTCARDLYDKDVMAGMSDDDFLPMMFYDACFLVMYILKRSRPKDYDAALFDLFDFFESNATDMAHDMMLLENQIPWQVVDAIMSKCTSEPLEKKKRFIARWLDSSLQDRVSETLPHVEWDEDYQVPHLLGLLRYYMVGKSSRKSKVSDSDFEKMESIATSAGAVELAEMGIFLTAREATKLPDMGLDRKWIVFNELSMAPLSLNDARASSLVNMAALELCTTPDFLGQGVRRVESAVCSYLLLLCMLTHREEDVHELRTKGILQGGAGLSNKKALDFFTSLQSLRQGRCIAIVMVEIENYRRKKRPWIKVYALCYRYRTTIAWATSALVGFISIMVTLKRAL